MTVKVKGVQQVVNKLNIAIRDISDRAAVRGVKEACMYIATASAKEVPVDTSTLLNSQFTRVDVEADRIVGKIGYTAPYAGFVHDAPGKYLETQTDRPVRRGEMPGSRGVIWGPNGNPKFLYWPAKDAAPEVRKIILRNIGGI